MKYCFLFIFFILRASAAEAPLHYTEGTWVSREFAAGVPKFRVEVDSANKKVFFTFLKQNELTYNSVGITFIESSGNKFLVELRAMDPLQFPTRLVGGLSKANSFVGFELRIPLNSQTPTIIHSRELIEVEE